MVDKRHKNKDWLPGDEAGRIPTWERVQIAILLDIRDDMKAIHSLVACHNVQLGFIAMQRLDKHLRKKWPLPKRKSRAKK